MIMCVCAIVRVSVCGGSERAREQNIQRASEKKSELARARARGKREREHAHERMGKSKSVCVRERDRERGCGCIVTVF